MTIWNDPAEQAKRQAHLQYLLDLDIPDLLAPDQRLLLAVLRQAIVDYFSDDPTERLDAALYFARSPVYRATLQLFDLPDDTLPLGVDLTDFRRKERMNEHYELDPMRLETLVRQLSGTQLKIVLTMGLLPLPAVTRRISLSCSLTRSTVLVALNHLVDQGLVVREEVDGRAAWSFPADVRQVIQDVWGGRDG